MRGVSTRGTRGATRTNSRKRRGNKRRKDTYETGLLKYAPYAILVGIIVVAYIFKGEQIIAYGKGILDGSWLKSFATVEEKLTADNSICTEGNVVKVLAHTLENERQEGESSIIWYTQYYETLDNERFDFFDIEEATQPMTYEKTSMLVEAMLGEGYHINLESPSGDPKEVINFSTFLGIYEETISYVSGSKPLTYESLGILSTPATDNSLEAWQVLTDKGKLGFEGIVLDLYKDHTIKALVVDGEILGVMDVVSTSCLIEKCYVELVEDDYVVLSIGEDQVTYKNEALPKEAEGNIYNVVVNNGAVTLAELQQLEPDDRVLRITDEYIELEQAGRLAYDSVAIYDTTNNSKWKNLAQVSSGVGVSFIEEEGTLNTLHITSKDFGDEVRVLISEDGMNNYYHEEVILTATGSYVIESGDKQIHLPSGATFSANAFSWSEGDKVVIRPLHEANTLQFETIRRQSIAPVYKGAMEISREPNGMYIVVNEVSMEDYLAAVIPSEMPTSYGVEALKVQAVAARSYARSHQTNSKFMRYGAQVDDTTASQVYNNVAADEKSYEAARETEGVVLKYNEDMVSGNFFSTSAGHTANYGEVWAQGEIFPTNTPGYLVAGNQYIGERDVLDLRDEEGAYTFFTMAPYEIDAFDNHAPWFRWEIDWTNEQLTNSINNNIYRLSSQYANLIKVLNDDNMWESRILETIGTVRDIKVEKRGEGGNVMTLRIIGDEATIQVSTEYVIRCLLSPYQKTADQESIKIVRADESVIENMTMLPSAFFVLEPTYDKGDRLETMKMYGGGFGHGVGMSQEGVKGMADRGYTYDEILQHYYTNVEIVQE